MLPDSESSWRSTKELRPWARFLLAAIMIQGLGRNSLAAMSGYCVATAGLVFSQYLISQKLGLGANPGLGAHVVWRSRIWSYSWPFAAWGVFTWAQLASDRWALGLFGSVEDVGLYAALFQIGYYPMSAATGMATQLLSPIFFQRAGDGTDSGRMAEIGRLAWRLTVMSLALTGFACLLALMFHQLVFRLLVSSNYAKVSYLLPSDALGRRSLRGRSGFNA